MPTVMLYSACYRKDEQRNDPSSAYDLQIFVNHAFIPGPRRLPILLYHRILFLFLLIYNEYQYIIENIPSFPQRSGIAADTSDVLFQGD